MSSKVEQKHIGYLPDETPPIGKLILFALQQILVMFPATVLVALLTGFHVSTTIFASGLATLGFILITKRTIPLFYGSSFSYIAAIVAMTSAQFGQVAPDERIRMAQFGIVMSGLVSIAAGVVIDRFGRKIIEKILPPTITGPIALTIGVSLAVAAINNAAGGDPMATGAFANTSWIIAIITLVATILFSVYLRGTYRQLPILFGILVGYLIALIVTLTTDIKLINLAAIGAAPVITMPHFTLPKPNLAAILAIMPIAIATIPESAAHLFQLDIYVQDLAHKKESKKDYAIRDKLGLNLIGDGIGDMISAFIGGPAGTNYGENLSTMAITQNFSVSVLIAAAVITMLIAFSGTLSAAVSSIPPCVIGGLSIYLFGIIGAQGIAIMLEQKVDLFDAKNLAVIAVILIIGIGGSFINGGMIPMFGIELPAIATASLVGILLNLILRFKANEGNA